MLPANRKRWHPGPRKDLRVHFDQSPKGDYFSSISQSKSSWINHHNLRDLVNFVTHLLIKMLKRQPTEMTGLMLHILGAAGVLDLAPALV